MNESHPKLSTSLGLPALQEATEEVERLEILLAEARAVRDDLIRKLADDDVRISRLSKVSGLSRQQIWRIAPGRMGQK